MDYLQWSFWIVGLSLQYLVASALLQGSFRRFPAIFGYLLCLIVTTVADIVFAIDKQQIPRLTYFYYFYTAELVRQTALYIVVISLVLTAMPVSQRRSTLIRFLLMIAALFWSGSLFIYKDLKYSMWMSTVVRNLSFCSALVNLALWFVLIASEKKDSRLLIITGGLGIQMTGDAIGQSLRQISHDYVIFGNLILVGTHFLCLYVWWQAFQPGRKVSQNETRADGNTDSQSSSLPDAV